MSDVDTQDKPDTKFDAEAFAMNIARAMETSGQALAAYLKPRQAGEVRDKPPSELAEVIKTFSSVAEYWMADKDRAADLQHKMGKAYLDLWGSAMRRMAGEGDVQPRVEPSPRDKRFKDPEWKTNQFFDFVMQAYLLTTRWAQDLVKNAEGLDPHTRKKAEFYVQEFTNALAPSNFVLTNPEVLRQTISSNAENLVRGMKMLAEDIEAGGGTLKIRQSAANLEVGRDLALTPGKVIYQNEIMQLIQYTPTTENVLRTPLLIVPPWINKFYILDLNVQKSYIKWCVDQGITVFVISWVNPDKSLGGKTFEDYMHEGPLTAMDVIEKTTGEMRVHTMGYCVGGTLLASTLAYLAEKRRQRVTSATFFAAQVDFSHAGDLLVFVDEDQISALERDMQESGVLEGSKMAMAFNMLRSNDLIWSYVVNNYLKGQPPSSFDLLHWNSDATRMPSSNHSYYLRNCYLENRLSTGTMVLDNTLLDLSKVKVPVYNLAAREDHIAPAESVLYGSQFFGGPVRFVLSGSGHIAGVVNPPAAGKYQYWTK